MKITSEQSGPKEETAFPGSSERYSPVKGNHIIPTAFAVWNVCCNRWLSGCKSRPITDEAFFARQRAQRVCPVSEREAATANELSR